MARVTTEDCTDKVPNRFELVMLAAHRSRELSSGKKPPRVKVDNDKHPVIALREIAVEAESAEALRDRAIRSYQTEIGEEESDEFNELDPFNLNIGDPNSAFSDVDRTGEANSLRAMINRQR